jgi:hypothetical protein
MSTQPNPKSTILSSSIIGGAGIGLPSEQKIPRNMGCVLLYAPAGRFVGKTLIEIQNDIGLPWRMGDDGKGFWFEGEPPTPTPTVDAAAELNKLRNALENVRMLASRHAKEDWAQHMLRFCNDVGVKANPLR